jgi:tetratricopeptide (TPR) repeat protein
MRSFEKHSFIFVLLITAAGLFLASCSKQVEKPEKGSEAYKKAVSDFYISLAAIQADRALFAVEKMDSLAEQYPPEAAIWANLGVFAMRQGNFEEAEKRIKKAIERDPNNADILFLAGILESRRGNVDASARYLRKASEKEPSNAKIAYALADELERQDLQTNADEVFSILKSIIDKQPDNLAVLLELVRTSVKWNNEVLLKQAMDTLSEKAEMWPGEIRRQFQEIRQTILQNSGSDLTFQLAFLRNNLNQLPQFQSDLAAVQIPPNQVGFLITDFSWLPKPSTSVAEADQGLTFELNLPTNNENFGLVRAVALSDSRAIDEITVSDGRAVINGNQVISFPEKSNSKYAIETIDYNYDFLNDLAFAGSSGLKLYRQQEDSTFVDVTPSTKLPSSVVTKSYYGVWSRDIDLDGDLDLVLSPESGSALVLRNNGDGSFQKMDLFSSVQSPRNFVWADFDGDADSDAVFLSKSGEVQLFLNERSVEFTAVENIPHKLQAIDIEVADINNDGTFDLLIWNNKGIYRVYHDRKTGEWKSNKLVDSPKEFENVKAGMASLYSVDIDNNGANDLIISTPQRSAYWLNSENLQMESTFKQLPAHILDIADLNEDTRLDLLTLNDDGKVQKNVNRGSKNYIARIIRPRASGELGDQRINSFGIGGELEIRSGLLYQKQLIKKPWVHLGLGTYEEAELLRIIWPNGSSQTEFAELGYGSKIFNEQILKGSCPWIFAYNGEEMQFVTDFLWRSPLGLRINAQTTAGVVQTEDRIKIGADQLEEKDGYYELRITADLWETHFFDHISLMAVDHPKESEMYIDERFAIPAPDLSANLTAKPKPVASATDDKGEDVSKIVSKIDGNYLHHFKATKYQGVAEDHFVDVKIGEEAPKEGPLWLLAHGWVRPTDSSINFALSQGSNPTPKGLSIEVPDGNGNWEVVKSDLGFPAGKSKTIMINLENIFNDKSDRRLRLRTTTETYWDAIQWAEGLPETDVTKRALQPQKMELRYRGFSEIKNGTVSTPEMPNYQNLSGTTPKWFDLKGYYTRFGDISELLKKVDDRYVIMNAGDEMVLRFKAPASPKKGWKRDFVLIGDGWVKDGDYNTKFSETVLPLPSHQMDQYKYDTAPRSLAEDSVYQQHRMDWVDYHTRYITPRNFRAAFNFE